MVTPVGAAAKQKASEFLNMQEFNKSLTDNVNNVIKNRDAYYDKSMADFYKNASLKMQDNNSQRQSEITRGSIAAGGQVGAAQAGSAANVMEQSRLNKQFDWQQNQSMGLDAKGNVTANKNAFLYEDGSSTRSGGSYSESFGVGAVAPSGYSTNAYGQRSLYDASAVANWRQRQDGVLNDMHLVEKRSSDLDRDKQAYLAAVSNRNQIDLMNRQASLDAQRAGNDRAYQSQQSAADRANQRYLAQMDANTRMYQSMFNGNGNGFQYWGGSI